MRHVQVLKYFFSKQVCYQTKTPFLFATKNARQFKSTSFLLNIYALTPSGLDKNLSSELAVDVKDKSDYQLVDKPGKIYKRPYHVRYAIGLAHYKEKKKHPSWLAGRTGSDHPSYKHGQSQLSRLSYGTLYTAWLIGVKQKSNFRCFITGETHKSLLECHHIASFSTNEEIRFDINNGVVMHKAIHKEFHSIYGYDVNVHMLEDFLIKNYNWGNKPFPWQQGNHEPSLSVAELQHKLLTAYEKQMINFLKLCEANNHNVLDGEYLGIKAEVTIQCNTHQNIFKTTFKNYKNSRWGLPCCGKESQQQKALLTKRNSAGQFMSEKLTSDTPKSSES
jgi:hypothetical protein